MEVVQHSRRSRWFLWLVALAALGTARAQWISGGPSGLPAEAPGAAYEIVDAFPGLTFPLVSDAPIALATPPGRTNELFIGGLFGKIYVITNLQAPTKTVFLDVSSNTFAPGATASESGLVGLAFHPKYSQNRYFYVFYTRTNRVEQRTYDTLSRFETDPANPWRALPGSEQILISQRDRNDIHQAGDLQFGPDGYLYVSLGDEGLQNDFFRNSQRIDKDFFSGILRLDVDGRPGSLLPNPHPSVGTGYRVPPDNPFVGATSFNGAAVLPGLVRTEFWAVGLRNPHRFSFDSLTGEMYGGDVGGSRLEEVNRYVRGGNYGWGYFEGTLPNPDAAIGFPPAGFTSTPPIYEYPHTGDDPNYTGHAVIGGLVYRGSEYPDLYGKYIFGDVYSAHVWAMSLNPDGAPSVTRIATGRKGMSSFTLHPGTGEILLSELFGGRITKLRRTPIQGDPTLPATLSGTRVFANLANLTPQAGIQPYEVASTFWSDNALKRRWFFMQNAADRIHRDASEQWSFPTGTVWVKHFDFEMVVGNPASRRRLETRFLVKTIEGVYGVTYKWRADGTDADLVPDSGLNESLVIQDGGITRTQVWRYPGRSECVTCHNGAARHVLGFNALQLNRDIDVGGVPANQITRLAALGVFDSPPPAPESLPRLAPVEDTTATLEHRFKTYVEVNCAYCHLPGGLGRGVFDARFSTSLEASGMINGNVNDDLGVPGARVIKPGDPEGSVLWRRIANLGPDHMPPLGTSVLNTAGISLVRQFIDSVAAPEVVRKVWQIGQNAPPGSPDYDSEFTVQNNRNDPAPGLVTRIPADPLFNASANPGADDDFYFAGTYPAGFNGLTAPLQVAYDEPARAWERAHTLGDLTNRIHFSLAENQAMSGARFRLSVEFAMGGSSVNGVLQRGFGAHDITVRFRNGAGVTTPMFTGRLTQPTTISLDFAAATVGATPGGNTIELVRTGPAVAGTSYWIEYDYVQLECLATGNTPPFLTPVEPQTTDELAPWVLSLQATDVDIPANRLTFSLVTGPQGLSVDADGIVKWTPTEAQGPSTNEVVVMVTDNAVPPLSATGRFSVIVRETPDPISALRTVWEIGRDAPPTATAPETLAEFALQNNVADTPPGRVTRRTGDPQFIAGANPGADDDFYFAGTYPAGFNGLTGTLSVPNDEPPIAWERAHTLGDPANRFHFILAPSQAAAGTRFRLRFELPTAGSMLNGVPQAGFGLHDFTVRFRNGNGVVTPLFSSRLSQRTDATVEFFASGVRATPGANTIELVRTGPAAPGTSYWLEYDYVRLEVLPADNTPPVFAPVGTVTINELVPWTRTLTATDADLPANRLTYSLISGPDGLVVSPDGIISWIPSETQGPSSNGVFVRVTDDGTPPLSATNQFTVIVNDVPNPPGAPRTVWQIGTDAPPTATLASNYAEFSVPNYRNDPAPGRVTRLPGDPLYVAATNPRADDDFYFAGSYPAGFNGLTAPLQVPNDEPPSAWEYDHTLGDSTNRFHFVLTAGQAGGDSRLRLTFEFPTGGSYFQGRQPPGFATHDMVVRFRNGAGVGTVLYSGRWTSRTNLYLEFPVASVAATPGANSIEFVRIGPAEAGVVYWVTYDFVRLEALPGPSSGSSGGTPSRGIWQVGNDALPTDSMLSHYSEFSRPNHRNDAPPGAVTRIPGDPQYVLATNPTADDDFYFAGTYGIGFNGLIAALSVPNDEPPSAWEYDLTLGDSTNRMHFVLGADRIVPGARFRLSFEFPTAGSVSGGQVIPGFATHDVVARFRNGSGTGTLVYSGRLTQRTNIVVEFAATDVAATAGPNSIEFVRTGPAAEGVAYWLTYDFVRLEALPGTGTTAGSVARTSARGPSAMASATAAAVVPAPSAPPVLIPGRIRVEDVDYLTLTYSLPVSAPAAMEPFLEASEDLLHWQPADAVVLEQQDSNGGRTITVRAAEPMDRLQHRFLRLKVATGSRAPASAE